MKAPHDFLLGMQSWLKIISTDCYCADAFTSGLGGVNLNVRWQRAVDTIYRFFICDILSSPSTGNISGEFLRKKYYEYALMLASNDPFVGSNEINPVWFSWDLCGTESCRILLDKHNIFSLQEGELSESLAWDLEKLFRENGAPLNELPIIPISKVIRS